MWQGLLKFKNLTPNKFLAYLINGLIVLRPSKTISAND
jgi:hypothetical protein